MPSLTRNLFQIFFLNILAVVLALGGWGRENSRESGLSSVEMVR